MNFFVRSPADEPTGRTGHGGNRLVHGTAKSGFRRMNFALMAATAITLSLELLFTRFISLLFNNYEAYWVIGIGMLGFGAGGALVAAAREKIGPSAERLFPLLMTGIGAAGVLPVLLFRILPLGPAAERSTVAYYAIYSAASLACVIPFFLASVLISLLCMTRREKIGTLYFFDLLGSGIGCFLFLFLMAGAGVEKGILLLAAASAAGSFLFLRGKPSRSDWILPVASIVFTALLAFLWRGPSPIVPCVPQMLTLLRDYQGEKVRLDYQKWDPVARIDITSVEGEEIRLPDRARYKLLTQDGDAPSILLGFDKPYEDLVFPERTLLGIAYWTKKDADILIIGLGGGPDVAVAAHFRPKRVSAVEMNKTSIRLVKEDFDRFVGGLYNRPEVRLVHDEGRHFVRRTGERYDVIQLTGVDTYLLGSVGAIQNLSENYLYTMEAFHDYYDHLKPDGILSLTYPDFSNWALRALAMSLKLLDEEGAVDPAAQILVTMSGGYNNILVKKSPFTTAEVKEITSRFDQPLVGLLFPIGHRLWGTHLPGIPWAMYYSKPFFERQGVLYDGSGSMRNAYSHLIENWPGALSDEKFAGRFLAGFRFATDDAPFFFLPTMVGGKFFRRLTLLLAFTALLIAAPLLLIRRRGIGVSGSGPLILLFASIGFGYIAIEMNLLQKFVLYLGHPSYSFAAILSILLVSSGIGSLASDRLAPTPARAIAIAGAAVFVYAVLFVLFIPAVAPVLLHAPAAGRFALVALLVAPLGFCMGIPFPSGIRLLEGRSGDFVPWAWGINGSASVLGSIGGLFLAVKIGFAVLMIVAAACYLAAAAAAFTASRNT